MTKVEIRKAFERLDALLGARRERLVVEFAGGAAMALVLDGRESTKDVDATRVSGCAPAVWQGLVAEVGAALGLPSDWLNTRASVYSIAPSEGRIVFEGAHLIVRSVATVQLLAMKRSALRDEVDYADGRILLRACSGDRGAVWRAVEPYLLPGFETWRRQNFDALWEDVHGPG